MSANDRRLIEDYLPLDVLNAIASREKLHPRRYVELVHYWPARPAADHGVARRCVCRAGSGADVRCGAGEGRVVRGEVGRVRGRS